MNTAEIGVYRRVLSYLITALFWGRQIVRIGSTAESFALRRFSWQHGWLYLDLKVSHVQWRTHCTREFADQCLGTFEECRALRWKSGRGVVWTVILHVVE
jgi:hypothetical protein